MKRSVWLYMAAVGLTMVLPGLAGEIHRAAGAGDLQKVQALLKANPALASERDLGTTPLHEAARQGHLAVVKLLVANGADINARDSSGVTALKLATGYQRKDVVAWLLQSGATAAPPKPAATKTNPVVTPVAPANPASPTVPAPPSITDRPGVQSPTSAVALPTPRPAAPAAVQPPQKPPSPARPGGPALPSLDPVVFPIHEAAEVGEVGQIKALLKAWPELLEAQNEKGLTPLHVAAANGRKEAVETLLVRKADVNAKTKYGWMPIHFAATKGDAPTVAIILAYGGQVNARTRTDDTPLHMAVRKGAVELVRLLLDRNADPNVAEKSAGSTPLHLAAAGGSAPMVEMLIAKGADVNRLDPQGDSPLTLALFAGHDAAAEMLQRHGAKEPAQKPLTPLEQSLVDYYRAMDQTLKTGTAAEKRKAALGMIPTRAEAQKIFPKHAQAAAKVVDELAKEVKTAFDHGLVGAPDKDVIWKMQPTPPSPYVQYCRSKGFISPDVPVYTLVVKKKGRKSLADVYCFVNGHWVALPSLGRIIPD